jgi:histone-lysine N-methyltransferase SETMAR
MMIVRMLSETYGDDAPSQRFVYKWAQRFRDGRKSLEDDPRSGRPKTTAGLAEAISEILQERPFESVRTLAATLEVSRETIRETLHNELGLRKFVIRLVPHSLSPSQKQKRVEVSLQILHHLESPGGCDNVITGDETWVFHENAHDSVWAASSAEAGTRVSRTIGAKKSMVSVFWTIRGFLLVDVLPEGGRFNSDYASELLHKLEASIGESRPVPRLLGMFLHWDNARPHKSAFTTAVANKLRLGQIPQPPYSPDIAPSDFFLFGMLKQRLKGQTFGNQQELLSAVWAELSKIGDDVLQAVFEDWKARLRTVIENGGEYIIR